MKLNRVKDNRATKNARGLGVVSVYRQDIWQWPQGQKARSMSLSMGLKAVKCQFTGVCQAWI